jgi:very-short-patch-repair endonuclease
MSQHWKTYNPRLKQIARTLRNNMTLSEILLWKEIKGKKVLGYDFHRQKPLGEYIVDFYCPKLKLVIEIDGDSHDGNVERISFVRRN